MVTFARFDQFGQTFVFSVLIFISNCFTIYYLRRSNPPHNIIRGKNTPYVLRLRVTHPQFLNPTSHPNILRGVNTPYALRLRITHPQFPSTIAADYRIFSSSKTSCRETSNIGETDAFPHAPTQNIPNATRANVICFVPYGWALVPKLTVLCSMVGRQRPYQPPPPFI